MARIETSSLISNITGKLNGTVFQRGQGGLIMRNSPGKINSNTLRSNSQRVGMSTIQGDWQGLTGPERLLWNTYAIYLNKKQKHSNSLIINGHQLFININSIRYALKDTTPLFSPYLLSTPVLSPIPQPINITTIERNGLNLEVNTDRAVTDTEDVVILYLSRPLSASQQSANQKLTLMKFVTGTGSQQLCNEEYKSVYGRTIDAGEWVQSKISCYNINQENYSSYSVQRLEVQ
jgi:hypothetical protein